MGALWLAQLLQLHLRSCLQHRHVWRCGSLTPSHSGQCWWPSYALRGPFLGRCSLAIRLGLAPHLREHPSLPRGLWGSAGIGRAGGGCQLGFFHPSACCDLLAGFPWVLLAVLSGVFLLPSVAGLYFIQLHIFPSPSEMRLPKTLVSE